MISGQNTTDNMDLASDRINASNSLKNRFILLIGWIHRLLIFFCECLGFYSVTGINSGNKGSNYLALIINIVYPTIYISMLIYVENGPHFWNLCNSLWNSTTNNNKKKFI